MIEAISPHEVAKAKQQALPDEVMRCWNDLIAIKFSSGQSYIPQEDIVNALMIAMDCKRTVIFQNNWLDIEAIYQAKGWKVKYDKPGFNEGGSASFTFTFDDAP